MDDDLMDVDGPSRQGVTIDDLASSTAMPSSASTAALLQTFENRKVSRSLAVPTNDNAVRLRLRDLGEPMTTFAESKVDRRERLREVLVRERQRRLQERAAAGDVEGGGEGEGEGEDDEVRSESEDSDEEQEEEFFTEGSEELLNARRDMAWFSLARAKRRIQRQQWEAKVPLTTIVGKRKAIFSPLKQYTSLGSQPADDRPISMVRFSPDGHSLATTSWSGSVKLWDVPSAAHRQTLRGHSDKVGGVAWHPRATLDQPRGAANLVTGGAEGNVCLWSLEPERSSPLATLKGHAARVARVAFHPSGSYVGSASFDGTWRLWDVAAQRELLLQEGHSKEVYAVEFQGDGALAASGGLDAIGRVWDLRTGRTAMVLDGHAKEILSVDFHPGNGYQVATASGDDTVRIWDMRALAAVYTIPAHKSSVADVRFFRCRSEVQDALKWEPLGARAGAEGEAPADVSMDGEEEDAPTQQQQQQQQQQLSPSGMYLATAGYDCLLKIWSADDWQLLRSLSGDNGKVMSCDVHPGGEYVASGEWGRSFKLWGAL